MISAERRSRVYPVWLPDSPAREQPVVRRRPRLSPMVGATVMAVFLTLPPLFYVSQRAQRAEAGYAILRQQRDLVKERAENDRLLAQAAALKSPQRIEYYATRELGMVPPHQRQLAAITVGPAIAQVPVPVERPGVLRQLASWFGSWFGRSEAEARERPR